MTDVQLEALAAQDGTAVLIKTKLKKLFALLAGAESLPPEDLDLLAKYLLRHAVRLAYLAGMQAPAIREHADYMLHVERHTHLRVRAQEAQGQAAEYAEQARASQAHGDPVPAIRWAQHRAALLADISRAAYTEYAQELVRRRRRDW